MKILVACECSGAVRRELRALGHDAWSCDLLPATDGSPHHLLGDVRRWLDDPWDAMLAFPDCTFLTNSAAWAYGDGPYHQKVKRATLVGAKRREAREDQFGDNASKSTCLWLKGLPPLRTTRYVLPRRVCKCEAVYPNARLSCPSCGASRSYSKPRWANQTDSGQNRLSPSDDRASIRSLTYPGIARAMAKQWFGKV